MSVLWLLLVIVCCFVCALVRLRQWRVPPLGRIGGIVRLLWCLYIIGFAADTLAQGGERYALCSCGTATLSVAGWRTLPSRFSDSECFVALGDQCPQSRAREERSCAACCLSSQPWSCMVVFLDVR